MVSHVYTQKELLELGFDAVGDNPFVSRDARFYAITGSLGENVRIDAFSILTGKVFLRDNTHISPFCFLGGTGGSIEMAAGSGLSTHVSIFTKSADYTSHDLKNSSKIYGNVYIGENSIIGAGSKVMPSVTISKNVSVGCHCVINENIQSGSVIISRGMGLVPVSHRE